MSDTFDPDATPGPAPGPDARGPDEAPVAARATGAMPPLAAVPPTPAYPRGSRLPLHPTSPTPSPTPRATRRRPVTPLPLTHPPHPPHPRPRRTPVLPGRSRRLGADLRPARGRVGPAVAWFRPGPWPPPGPGQPWGGGRPWGAPGQWGGTACLAAPATSSAQQPPARARRGGGGPPRGPARGGSGSHLDHHPQRVVALRPRCHRGARARPAPGPFPPRWTRASSTSPPGWGSREERQRERAWCCPRATCSPTTTSSTAPRASASPTSATGRSIAPTSSAPTRHRTSPC